MLVYFPVYDFKNCSVDAREHHNVPEVKEAWCDSRSTLAVAMRQLSKLRVSLRLSSLRIER